MLGSTVSVLGESDDCRKALEELGCLRYSVVEPGTFRARVVRLALHDVLLLRTQESLGRIATYSCAPGKRRFILPPRAGNLACNGVEALPKTILTHGPGDIVFERVSSSSETQSLILSEETLLESFRALQGTTLSFPRGLLQWQPGTRSLRRVKALFSAGTRMTVSSLDLAHGAESYRGLEQEIITEMVFSLADREGKLRGHRTDGLAEAFYRAEAKFGTIEEPSLAVRTMCLELGISERTLQSRCLKLFGRSATQYHRLVREQIGAR